MLTQGLKLFEGILGSPMMLPDRPNLRHTAQRTSIQSKAPLLCGWGSVMVLRATSPLTCSPNHSVDNLVPSLIRFMCFAYLVVHGGQMRRNLHLTDEVDVAFWLVVNPF